MSAELRELFVYDTVDGRLCCTVSTTPRQEWGDAIMLFTPDGGRLITSCNSNELLVSNVADGGLLARLPGHDATVIAAAISPDGRRIASGTVSGHIHVWNADSYTCEQTLMGHTAAVSSLVFRDDETLASGSLDGTVRFWSSTAAEPLAVLPDIRGMSAAVFSPDGRQLAVAPRDHGGIQIWDPRTIQRIHTLIDTSDTAKQIAYSREPGDIGDQYNSFLDCEEIDVTQVGNGDVVISRDGKLLRPKRLPSNLFQFRAGSGEDRCVLDCINSLQNGADLLWIETEKPHIGQIAGMVNRIRDVIPNAKLVYNNSPSFNWTLNFRQQVYDAMAQAGKAVSAYDRARLMSVDYDATELAQEADERIRTFQRDAAAQAGIFHHLITLPTYHTAALSTDNLAREYFGDQGMLGYVKNVQRAEIRQGIACVKHQNMSGSDIGDDHKEYFAGEAALKAGGAHNTMNQFAA
jgi:hypothetical protein